MIKIFCDKCRRELPIFPDRASGTGIHQYDKVTQSIKKYLLCDNCVEKFDEWIGDKNV